MKHSGKPILTGVSRHRDRSRRLQPEALTDVSFAHSLEDSVSRANCVHGGCASFKPQSPLTPALHDPARAPTSLLRKMLMFSKEERRCAGLPRWDCRPSPFLDMNAFFDAFKKRVHGGSIAHSQFVACAAFGQTKQALLTASSEGPHYTLHLASKDDFACPSYRPRISSHDILPAF